MNMWFCSSWFVRVGELPILAYYMPTMIAGL